MLKLRKLVVDDLVQLIPLIKEAHAQCAYRTLPLHEPTLRQTCIQLIKPKRGFARGVFDGDTLVAALLASVQCAPGSLCRVASDHFFYSKRPWAGVRLMRAYVAWGREKPWIDAIGFSSSFMADERYNRAMERYAERLGFKCIGRLFMAR